MCYISAVSTASWCDVSANSREKAESHALAGLKIMSMGESRNAYRVLVGKPEGKRPLGRPRRRWEDNKMDLREILKVEALAKKPSYLILTVADGSLFIYKSHPKDTLRSDNTVNTVRILVKDSPVTVEECKDYDFVKLVAVDVDEIIEPNGESSELYMSLEMKFGKSGSKCRIVPLIDRENTAKRVKKQKEKLKSQNESEKPEGYGRQLVKEMLQGDFSEDLIGSATDNERETMDSRLSPLKRIRNISEKRPAPNEDENSKTKHKVMKTSDNSVISDEVLIIDDTESDEVTIIDDTESALPSQKESQPQWLSSIKEPHLKRVRERDKETGLRIRKRSNSNLNKDQKTGSATSKSNDKSTENEYELSSSVRKDTSKCNMRPKKRSISTPSLPLKERSTSVGNQNVSEREKSVLTASPPLPKKLRTATSLPTGNIRERNNSVSALGVSRNQDNASVAAAKQGRDQDFVSVIAEKQVRNNDCASVVAEKQSKNQDCASVVADKQVRNNDCASVVAEKQSKNQDCASVVADKQVRNNDCASVVAEKQSKNQDCASVVADKQVRNKDCASVVAEKQSKNQDCASVVAEKQNEQLTKSSSGTNKQQTSIKSPKKVQRSISLPQLPESAPSPQKASRSTTLPLSPPGTLITITNSRDFIKVMKDIEREVIRKHCMPESSLSVTQEEDNVERRDIFSQKLNMFNVNSKKKQLVTNLHSNDAPSCSSRLPQFDDTIDHAIRNLSETRIVREQMTDSSKSVVLNALNAGSHDGATVSLVTKQNKACETEQGMNNFPSRTKDDSPYKILPREMLRREENDTQDDVPTSESRNQQGNQSILRNHCENEMVSRNQHNSQPVLEIQQENQSNSRKQQEKKPISTNQQENQPGFVQVESQNVPLENNCQNLPYSDWSTYNSHPTHTHLAPIARVAPVCRQADNPTTSVNEEGDESVSCIRSEHTSPTVLKKELNTVEQESNDKVCETFLSLEEGSEHQGSQHSSAGHREKSSDEITETYSDFEVCVRNKGTQHFTSTQSSGSGNGGPVGVNEFQTFALSQAKSETQKLSSSVENEESDAEFESAIPHVVSVSALSAACSGQALQSECGGGSDQMSALSQACPRELSSKLSGEEFESANPHVVSGDKASALSCSGQALQSECGGRSDQTSALSQACPRELPSKLSGEEFESADKLRPLLLEQPEKQAQSSNCEAVKEVSVRETESADVPEIVSSDKLKSLSHDNPERESLSLKCEVESELSSGEYESVGSPSDNFWSLPHTCPEQQALTSKCGSKSDVSFEKLKSTELLCDKLKSLPHKPSEEQSGSSKPRTEVKLSDGECGSSGLPVVPREEQSILLHEHPEENTVSSEVSTEEFYSPDLTGTCSGKLKSLSNDRLEELSSHSEAENEGFESADLPGIPSDDLRPLLRECPVERTLSRKCDVEKGVSVGMLDSVAVPGTSSDTSRTLPLECAEKQAQSSNHEVESGFSFAESEIPEVLSSSFETVRELETEEEPETDNQTFASVDHIFLQYPGDVDELMRMCVLCTHQYMPQSANTSNRSGPVSKVCWNAQLQYMFPVQN
ncbi:hypothetical protein ANN_21752 [Periplaneta americana]|uniref:Uncharacterized protein n=1 Tax=Periplaneta americana TaxID=6978 RepID=A0ABQ8S6C4_PERAM|nr:hypothetical protein ANN_21752 [Periplaneta americana]